MSRRAVTFTGLAVAGGAGYYLYSAGGNPKVAQKEMEHDAATAARKLKGDLPGRDKEAKKAGEEGWEKVKTRSSEDRSAEGRGEAGAVPPGGSQEIGGDKARDWQEA